MNVDIAHSQSEKTLFGLWCKSNRNRQHMDIPNISGKLHAILQKKENELLPFYVVTKNYDHATGDFCLFVGGEIESDMLETAVIPSGLYGILRVSPIDGNWGIAIGRAKGFFYGSWINASPYQPSDLEYEYHTNAAIAEDPYIEIRFAIHQK